jgi:hypothetical protein
VEELNFGGSDITTVTFVTELCSLPILLSVILVLTDFFFLPTTSVSKYKLVLDLFKPNLLNFDRRW